MSKIKKETKQKNLITLLTLVPVVWLPIYIVWLGSLFGSFFDVVAIASSLIALLTEVIILVHFKEKRIKIFAVIGIICAIILLLGALADISLRSSLRW